MMKTTRQNVILSIIEKENIETQNQLMSALAKRGIKSTQATLSRDIRELHLVKNMTPDGIYRYTAPAEDEKPEYDERLRKIFRESVTHHADAQNIIVIKTLPGLAAAAALLARWKCPRHSYQSTPSVLHLVFQFPEKLTP